MPHSDPYIDIHTHSASVDSDVIAIKSVMLKDYDSKLEASKYVSLGIHPWDVTDADDFLNVLEKSLRKERVRVVGECGLDRVCMTPFEEQRSVFKKQLKLAKKYECPVVVHCVRAFDALLALQKAMPKVTFIVHGFCGKPHLAQQLLDKGFILSLGECLFNKPQVQKLALTIPLKQLFLETDEADIDIKALYEWMADLRGISVAELRAAIYKNFRKHFSFA